MPPSFGHDGLQSISLEKRQNEERLFVWQPGSREIRKDLRMEMYASRSCFQQLLLPISLSTNSKPTTSFHHSIAFQKPQLCVHEAYREPLKSKPSHSATGSPKTPIHFFIQNAFSLSIRISVTIPLSHAIFRFGDSQSMMIKTVSQNKPLLL